MDVLLLKATDMDNIYLGQLDMTEHFTFLLVLQRMWMELGMGTE